MTAEFSSPLSGMVRGDAQGENTSDSSPADITLNLQATMEASLPALMGLSIAEIIPLADETFSASVFDGDLDFGGSSGMSFMDLEGSDSQTFTFDSGNPLWAAISSLFSGPSAVDVDFDAVGSSQATGGANIASQFSAQASLDWDITYKYSVVPTPGAAALLGLGGLAVTRRRR